MCICAYRYLQSTIHQIYRGQELDISSIFLIGINKEKRGPYNIQQLAWQFELGIGIAASLSGTHSSFFCPVEHKQFHRTSTSGKATLTMMDGGRNFSTTQSRLNTDQTLFKLKTPEYPLPSSISDGYFLASQSCTWVLSSVLNRIQQNTQSENHPHFLTPFNPVFSLDATRK